MAIKECQEKIETVLRKTETDSILDQTDRYSLKPLFCFSCSTIFSLHYWTVTCQLAKSNKNLKNLYNYTPSFIALPKIIVTFYKILFIKKGNFFSPLMGHN